MKNKAVVLGANYYIALSVMRNLGKHGIHVTAMEYTEENAYALKSKYCSEFIIVPHYKNETKAFIQTLIDYAKNEEYQPVLLPCADPYVEIIDENMELLRPYYLFPKMKQGQYKEVMEKSTLESLAKAHGVKVPETFQMDDEALNMKVKEIGYPCLVKPSNSHDFIKIFRRKMFKVFNEKELREAIDLAKKEDLKVVVQEIVPGFDDHMYTFDAYLNDDSKVTHYLTCQKYRQYPINYGASVYTEQKHVEALPKIGIPFLEAIGYKGFGEIEFKKHEKTGEFYLIEINVRFSNLNELVTQAGLNMPYITYREMIGKPVEESYIKEDTGLVFRYTFEDLLAIKGYLKTHQLKAIDVFKSLFKKKVHAIRSLDDWKPMRAYLKMIIKKAIKRI